MALSTRTGLIELEATIPVTIRDSTLRDQLLNFGPPSEFVDHAVDLVLLASATGWLQEGDGGRAFSYAWKELDSDPDDADLRTMVAGITRDVRPSADTIGQRTAEYLHCKGYGPEVEQAFTAIADVYLGRVAAGVVHPILGAKCVWYFIGAVQDRAGDVGSELGARLARACAHFDRLWTEQQGDSSAIERRVQNLAAHWIHDRKAVDRQPTEEGL